MVGNRTPQIPYL